MGYTPYQPAPSPGSLPVDAPKRYGWGAPARFTSGAARFQPAGLGAAARTRRRLCGCLRFILSPLSLPTVAWPWGSSREPSPSLLSGLSPKDRRALCCGLLHPRRAHARRRPGPRPRPRPRGWLPGPGICVKDPGLVLPFRPAGSRKAREGGILGSALFWCKSKGKGSALEG